ncbi:TPA: type II/IV secretion system ATPase subunit [Candidatus Bathyarchaeota archaeon]|nr:type II/IV secretion system ATPase subunit [Candidatus Bathyarchaeota archaeon]
MGALEQIQAEVIIPPVYDKEEFIQRLSRVKGFNSTWDTRFRNNPHMLDYLNYFMSTTVEYPVLTETLSKDMSENKSPNYLYPVGDPIYIHVCTNKQTKSVLYKAIEPRLYLHRDLILGEIEKRIALAIDDTVTFSTIEEKTEYIYSILKNMTKLENREMTLDDVKAQIKPDEGKRGPFGLGGIGKQGGHIKVDQIIYDKLRYEVYCEKVGSSILEPYIRDIYIEDIHCSGVGPIYISHKIFGTLETSIMLENGEDLDRFALKLSEIVGKPASHRDPIIDAKMPDGSRLNLVFGEDVSTRGSNFTIRKFAKNPLSIIEVIASGTMSSLVAAYIWILLDERMSLWICGETASGKTTTLSAITPFIRATDKIVTIEEVPEVHCPHKNWIREVVRDSSNATSEVQGAVSMFQLLKAALRQRPNYIIVGEVRGQEGMVAFQAMQTGHASMATFHAASISKLVQRLTNSPISVPKTHVDNLNAALFQSAVHDPKTGRYKRRVLGINEILGYEPADEVFNFVEVFSYNAAYDVFEFRGLGTSFLLDSKIAIMRGYQGTEVKKIYVEMYKRAEILEFLLALGIKGYQEVTEAIQWVQNVGVDAAHNRYKRLCLTKFGYEIEQKIAQKVGKPP